MTYKSNNRDVGAKKEAAAASFLQKQGIRILQKNFRSRNGEIDLIGQDEDTLVFFEVKYRSGVTRGYPVEAVGYAKQKQICRTADFYRVRYCIPENYGMRFDVIAIQGQDITWIKNAFFYVL